MNNISNYIKEAFITKSNIKNVAKSQDRIYYFVPALFDNAKPFNKIKSFQSLEDLINIFKKYDKLNPFWMNPNDIVDIETYTSDDPGDQLTHIPDEYADDFKKYYVVRAVFDKHNTGNRSDYFYGWINCTKEELEKQ